VPEIIRNRTPNDAGSTADRVTSLPLMLLSKKAVVRKTFTTSLRRRSCGQRIEMILVMKD